MQTLSGKALLPGFADDDDQEEEDTPEGLRHLKKPEPQFKWKKERKR